MFDVRDVPGSGQRLVADLHDTTVNDLQFSSFVSQLVVQVVKVFLDAHVLPRKHPEFQSVRLTVVQILSEILAPKKTSTHGLLLRQTVVN